MKKIKTQTMKVTRRFCGVLCVAVLAAFALFAACERPEPEPEPEPTTPVVDTNDIKATWVCDSEDFCITSKFLSQEGLVYSSVNQSTTLNYQLLFSDSTLYTYRIEDDTILRFTQIWHNDFQENINSPFVIRQIAPDTVELFYIGFYAEPPFILDYYKFSIIDPR